MEAGEQLMLYQHVTGRISRDLAVPVHLGFAVLTKHKAPKMQMIEVPAGAGQVDRVLETVRRVWAVVEDGNYYPNPSPMNCSTCPYKSKCSALA